MGYPLHKHTPLLQDQFHFPLPPPGPLEQYCNSLDLDLLPGHK